jgi:hypothetical protein
MSENKKENGEQQSGVEKETEVLFYKYIVQGNLYEINNKFYYRLCKETPKGHKSLLIDVSKIVLAPDMVISISTDSLDNDTILDIETFDETTCLRLIEKQGKYSYIVNTFTEIIFPDEVKDLNSLYSGKVMEKMDSGFKEKYIESKDDFDIYEVKLDNEIDIESINRTFSKIYVYSKDLLNGFSLHNLHINPFSLFDCDHSSTYDKPILISGCYDKKEILSSSDYWLLKREKWFNDFNEGVYGVMFYGFIIFFLINIISTSEAFVFNWGLLIILIVPIAIIWMQSEKRLSNECIVIRNKSYIDRSRFFNISRTIIGLLIFVSFLFGYSKNYSYKTDYVYDSVKREFLKDNSFMVSNDLVFKKKKILKRYIPISSVFDMDLVYKNPKTLLSFSDSFIDLEIHIEFNKCDYLLDSNISNNLSKTNKIFQENISKGLYGDLSSMNTYEYRKFIIDLEEDIMNLLTALLAENNLIAENIVKNITINTKYAKLQNVD